MHKDEATNINNKRREYKTLFEMKTPRIFADSFVTKESRKKAIKLNTEYIFLDTFYEKLSEWDKEEISSLINL